MAENLLEKLKNYSKSDFYPMHMPGHKRRAEGMGNPFAIDITEIDGFDNLHHAQGALLEAQKRAAQLYGADETYYLVNGSTCGILAAVAAAVSPGGRILMARNCHKAAYHAVFLNGLHASYLYPEADMVRGINGSISPKAVHKALERQQEGHETDIQAVLITSPTYDGVVSDIRSIAEEVHRAGAILIVDEAHGAHFPMHPYFPEPALACGADIVINSLHKTMPSLTQTALLHVKGERADRMRLRRYLGIYQSSSPSYVLMAGMDSCVDLMRKNGAELFHDFVQRLEEMRRRLEQMKMLHLVSGQEAELDAFDYDRSKVLISTENCSLSGPQLTQILRENYHIEMEMAAADYVTAILTVCDVQEGYERLTSALLEIDAELSGVLQECVTEASGVLRERETEASGALRECVTEASGVLRERETEASGALQERKAELQQESPGVRYNRESQENRRYQNELHKNEEAMTIADAWNSDTEQIMLWESAGRISAEFVYLYPPGIPLLVPGERITQELLWQLAQYRSIGMELQGLSDYSGETIRAVKSDGTGADGFTDGTSTTNNKFLLY